MAAPVSQTFQQSTLFDHGSAYTTGATSAQDFLADIVTSIAAQSSPLWTVNASATNYVELIPDAGSAKPDSRILLSVAANTHDDSRFDPSYTDTLYNIFIGYIEDGSGGLTDPATGDAYPGQIWSKMISVLNLTSIDRFIIMESNDVFFLTLISTTNLSGASGAGLIHKDLSGDAVGGVVGMGFLSSMATTNFESYNATNALFNPGTTRGSSTGDWLTYIAASDSWIQVKRITHCTTDSCRNITDTKRYMFDIFFADVATGRLLGNAVHIKMGQKTNLGTIMLDGSSDTLAMAISGSYTEAVSYSTCWLINE